MCQRHADVLAQELFQHLSRTLLHLVEPFDGIAELWVESLVALETNWSTDKAKEYLEIFFKDEQNL